MKHTVILALKKFAALLTAPAYSVTTIRLKRG